MAASNISFHEGGLNSCKKKVTPIVIHNVCELVHDSLDKTQEERKTLPLAVIGGIAVTCQHWFSPTPQFQLVLPSQPETHIPRSAKQRKTIN